MTFSFISFNVHYRFVFKQFKSKMILTHILRHDVGMPLVSSEQHSHAVVAVVAERQTTRRQNVVRNF